MVFFLLIFFLHFFIFLFFFHAAELLASVLWLNEDAHAICAASDIWGMTVAQACFLFSPRCLHFFFGMLSGLQRSVYQTPALV